MRWFHDTCIVQDFATFSSIEPTEYVDNLFQLESRYDFRGRLTFLINFSVIFVFSA